jgi:hypothetical protein
LTNPPDSSRPGRISGGFGEITRLYRVIFTNKVLQYFSTIKHPVHQSGVAGVIFRIVFTVNSSGITGIVPRVIDVEKPDYGINPHARTPDQKKWKKPEMRAFEVKIRDEITCGGSNR